MAHKFNRPGCVDDRSLICRPDPATFSPGGSMTTFLGPGGDVEAESMSQELLRRAFGVASVLNGIPPGSRVAISHPLGLAYASAFLGTMAAGLVPVPVYPPDRAAPERTLLRLEAIAKNADAQAILTSIVLELIAVSLDEEISSDPLCRGLNELKLCTLTKHDTAIEKRHRCIEPEPQPVRRRMKGNRAEELEVRLSTFQRGSYSLVSN